jgi:hypothetical protein
MECIMIKLFFSNFGHFFQDIFSIRLIHGSTYSRVYTVHFLAHIVLRMINSCFKIPNILFLKIVIVK